MYLFFSYKQITVMISIGHLVYDTPFTVDSFVCPGRLCSENWSGICPTFYFRRTEEVSNCLLLSRIQGKITTSIVNVISLIGVILMSDFPYYYKLFQFLIFEFVADVIMGI
jgi:hypothetical protein